MAYAVLICLSFIYIAYCCCYTVGLCCIASRSDCLITDHFGVFQGQTIMTDGCLPAKHCWLRGFLLEQVCLMESLCALGHQVKHHQVREPLQLAWQAMPCMWNPLELLFCIYFPVETPCCLILFPKAIWDQFARSQKQIQHHQAQGHQVPCSFHRL